MLTVGWEGGVGAYLVHFVDNPLDFRLRISQKLEERGDPWEQIYALLQPCFYVSPLTIVRVLLF
jgi:hypothetical protein